MGLVRAGSGDLCAFLPVCRFSALPWRPVVPMRQDSADLRSGIWTVDELGVSPRDVARGEQ